MIYFPSVKLAICAGFLGIGSFCQHQTEPVARAGLVSSGPKVHGALLKRVPKPGCLDPSKKEFTVPELENGYRCMEDYASELEERNGALVSTLRKRTE